MPKPRIATTAAVIAAFALALTGCATDSGDGEKKTPAAAAPSTSAEAPQPPKDAASGDLVAPGATIEAGEWMTYEFEGSDGVHAVLQAKITGITPATDAQVQLLVGEIPELEGYEVSLITLEEKKLSGDDVTFMSDYTDFSPATTEGEEAQEVSVIGWDECSSESFTEEFNAGTASIVSCFIAAAVPGGKKIGGLLYEGPSAADENPYSSYDGKPVFLKG